jgi:RNA polymerase sporulation-specific sigma factor
MDASQKPASPGTPAAWCADREAIARAQHGERHAMDHLLRKYRRLVYAKARGLAPRYSDVDDLIQIGMIGLWHAITEFRLERAVSFRAFAGVCVRRQLISAVKATFRERRLALARDVELEGLYDSGGAASCVSRWTAQDPADPEGVLLARETMGEMCAALELLLTELEWSVLVQHQAGRSYRDIADELGCTEKAVDNALGRIRRKVGSVAHAPAELCAWVTMHEAGSGARRRAPGSARPTAHRRLSGAHRERKNGLRAAQATV